MSLAKEYRRQFKWRDWSKALDLCPISPGQMVLDLGCGPGDVSNLLADRGCIVIGVDANEELLNVARQECKSDCTFIQSDLSSLNLGSSKFDGLWCSFTAAYFMDFSKVFDSWLLFLKPNAWVCITDIDDLFGHAPIKDKFKVKVNEFYDQAVKDRRYDFRVGRKISSVLKDKGFLTSSLILEDSELSFQGKASTDVVQAWRDRLNRMNGLKTFLGEDYEEFSENFLACLDRVDHTSHCKVVCCYGRRSS